MKFNTDEVNRLIRERRSVFPRDYSGEAVKEEVIQTMLENANWAPNHKHTEPWRFVVFSGEGLRSLATFQAACYREVAMARGDFKPELFEKLLEGSGKSSFVIAVGMKRDERKSVPEIEESGAVFCAIQNMYLTATAYGVGCYLSTGGITYFEEAKQFFGLGKEDILIGFLHVGMPMKMPDTGRRKPASDKIKWVKA